MLEIETVLAFGMGVIQVVQAPRFRRIGSRRQPRPQHPRTAAETPALCLDLVAGARSGMGQGAAAPAEARRITTLPPL